MEQKQLLTRTPWKGILSFALPLMAANILQQLYSTVDTLVVGNFDSQRSLSAVGSCNYIVMLYIALSGGLSLGAGVLISQAFGAGDEKRVKQLSGGSICLLLLVGLISTVFSYATGSLFLKYLVSVPETIYTPALTYLRIYSIGLIFQYGYNIVAAILRSLGDSRSSMYFLIITSIVNIVLDIVFVAVFHWSVAGVAWATTISQCISMVVSFLYMFKKYPVLRFDRSYWKLNRSVSAEVLKLGIPLALQTVITSCGFMLLQRLVNSFGEEMTAAYTVACRVEIYMLVPFQAITSGISTFVGQNFGAGQMDRVKKGPSEARVLCYIVAAVVGIPCFIFATPIARVFGIQGQAVEFAVSQIRLVSFDLLLYATYQPFTGLFLGLSHSKATMTMSMIEIVGRVIGGYTLRVFIGVLSCWWSEPVAWVLVIAFATIYYIKKIRPLLQNAAPRVAE